MLTFFSFLSKKKLCSLLGFKVLIKTGYLFWIHRYFEVLTQQTKKVLKNEFCKKLNEEIRKSIEYQWKKEISILLLNLVHGVLCKSQYIYSNDTETTFIMYVVEKQYDYKSRKRYKECELKTLHLLCYPSILSRKISKWSTLLELIYQLNRGPQRRSLFTVARQAA